MEINVQIEYKKFLRWCITLRITGHLDFVITQNSKYWKTQHFSNWIASHP
jgi:hypothetical protein